MSQYVFGVDIGGTTVKLGLFDENGNILDKWEIGTNTEEDGKHILPDTAESILNTMKEKNIDKSQVLGVGVGAPGPIDDAGMVYGAANLGWDTFSISGTLQELLDLPIKAANDANVAALGEMWKGGGKGYKNLLLVTLGTGVGGGVINNEQILTGTCGAGGEIGHMHINDDETEICGCGGYGCMEQYASATGVKRIAERTLAVTDTPSVLRERKLTAKAIFDAVKEGDEMAIDIAKQFGEYLGKSLASVATVLNPEAIVIGGGVSKAGEILFEYIKPPFMRTVFHGCKNVEFTLATLENDAGIYGAAKLILG